MTECAYQVSPGKTLNMESWKYTIKKKQKKKTTWQHSSLGYIFNGQITIWNAETGSKLEIQE